MSSSAPSLPHLSAVSSSPSHGTRVSTHAAPWPSYQPSACSHPSRLTPPSQFCCPQAPKPGFRGAFRSPIVISGTAGTNVA
ncbi:hypothetical protein CC85DRAFT_286886 [Cutaneotrichosporon oleaginosum]|uniref:Uncharacterized protein n=1 Tax=Cutaneotrichosporon oleaginosum TaxID=879819 RepID=A0A0J0XIS7_9TREE|nr:uncharacterized protein CC85DRAFT_286886 [Cutaneotrichosporon oleaginosum]KLT40957.1 hypothetical protein CC85DRAFT_286886 [Cutaneotrichosporon oleaginosum]TXT06227.1 hypothetical protein COLE_05558 [Cutaneotrichosporon oleaginosum]